MQRIGLLVLFSFFVVHPTQAVVDTKNASYSDTWTDFSLPGTRYPLRIQRTYSSRSLFNGMFGFGWCSDPETKLEVTAEGNLKVTECGGGLEITYLPKNFKSEKYQETVEKILAEVKRRNKNLTPSYINALTRDLKTNELLRNEFAKELGLRGDVDKGQTFYAAGRETETITLKGTNYLRTLSNGDFQLFNSEGRMIRMQDRNGNSLTFNWTGDILRDITDSGGRKLSFSFHPEIKKVKCVTGPQNLKACYEFKGDDLVKLIDSEKQVFQYSYDENHNMLSITFPDKTKKVLTYNKDMDWVTSFTDRDKCTETYDYQSDKNNPTDHYWTVVEKRCGKEVVNKGRFEFWYRMRPDKAGKFLYRVLTETLNESVDIVYHEVHGKPISVRRNNNLITYTYYPYGLVRTKAFGNREMAFEYDLRCQKPSSVRTRFFDEKGKKVIRTVLTKFEYESRRCNLAVAKNSDGQVVRLAYDIRGRIGTITDQAKKVVNIDYEEKFGKPFIVNRPGLGSIQVSYKTNGEIDKVVSKEGPTVAIQVASVFNNLLDLIAPATTDVSL